MTENRPFFSFYGSKWRDALKHYPAPKNELIIEPFAGSAGYSVRHANREVILCDRDPIIAALWAWLIRAPSSEIRDLPANVDSNVIAQLRPEAQWLIGFWLNKATSRPRRNPSAWMRSGVRPGSFWGKEVRDRIAAQVATIRHWTVQVGDYMNLANQRATWFIDPPYAGRQGTHYAFGSSRLDYNQLASWSRNRQGQIIVCESGGTWLPFRPISTIKTARAHRSLESVWTSTND